MSTILPFHLDKGLLLPEPPILGPATGLRLKRPKGSSVPGEGEPRPKEEEIARGSEEKEPHSSSGIWD